MLDTNQYNLSNLMLCFHFQQSSYNPLISLSFAYKIHRTIALFGGLSSAQLFDNDTVIFPSILVDDWMFPPVRRL